ncbi:hypothetical protein SAMN05443428_1672 [Caloramator quimbayensis]|uniref:Uncharacterized protein n=1 Tax=Caloramator quimbayensis TaxID=1147123 RepID=A0A1T4YK08_9CLOT|nr:hypothetical protein [Caloramator quimbayensis]SKB01605.1 hypothetical protein SAMN05443428_1672 [Caloramator quimbayensis]
MFWKQFLIIFALTAISLVIFYYIRATILVKYKINKNYFLAILIILFILPLLFSKQYASQQWISYIQVLLVSLTFLSYMEIARINKAEKNKPVIGRPKAKPSRIKDKESK